MRKIQLVMLLWAVAALSCGEKEAELEELERPVQVSVQFAVPGLSNGAGRTETDAQPKAVLVTILNPDNSVLMTRRELTVYRVGTQYLSLPLTLDVTAASANYKLHEFLVVGTDNQVTHLTPKEGSVLAHLVRDPLDIQFTVSKDVVTMVEPEVISVSDESSPADYGYSQFKMSIVETIRAKFLPYVATTGDPQAVSMNLELTATLADGTSWRYATTLLPQANVLTLKKGVSYRIKAMKQDYQTLELTRTISEGDQVDLVLNPEPLNGPPTVTALMPGIGRPGDVVLLHGSNLGTRREDIQEIFIGPWHCQVVNWVSRQQVMIQIPQIPVPPPGTVWGPMPVTGRVLNQQLICYALFDLQPPLSNQ